MTSCANMIRWKLAVSFSCGYGTSGMGTFRNLQRGSHPCFASNTRSLSAGHSLRTRALCSLNFSMQNSSLQSSCCVLLLYKNECQIAINIGLKCLVGSPKVATIRIPSELYGLVGDARNIVLLHDLNHDCESRIVSTTFAFGYFSNCSFHFKEDGQSQ